MLQVFETRKTRGATVSGQLVRLEEFEFTTFNQQLPHHIMEDPRCQG
ncbi:MAG: hypothetical protein GTO24_04740 [candidate division Zixibacteria bacterium]|nr:hypothetical protein [candidate division Zixibacteria bacterium]